MAPTSGSPIRDQRWGLPAVVAAIVVGALYLVTVLAGLVQVDLRFWIVALKPLSGHQALACLVYVAPFTVFTLSAFRGLDALAASGGRAHYAWAAVALAGGFALLTGAAYIWLFTTGVLPAAVNALSAASRCRSHRGPLRHRVCRRRTATRVAG